MESEISHGAAEVATLSHEIDALKTVLASLNQDKYSICEGELAFLY
jgi:hypothetical protein